MIMDDRFEDAQAKILATYAETFRRLAELDPPPATPPATPTQ